MTEFGLERSDMAAAGAAVVGVGQDVRAADGTAALSVLAGALPGSQTAARADELRALWREGVRDWSDDADAFAAGVADTARAGGAADGLVQDALGGFSFLLGGS